MSRSPCEPNHTQFSAVYSLFKAPNPGVCKNQTNTQKPWTHWANFLSHSKYEAASVLWWNVSTVMTQSLWNPITPNPLPTPTPHPAP